MLEFVTETCQASSGAAVYTYQTVRILSWVSVGMYIEFDTDCDRAKVPPYNGHDPHPSPGSLQALVFPPLSN